ncbi:active regulator of SIRT1-like [Ptychodera flava]|uniref:active regulator of SIRT1-like n=1 Tax=Ptychodera flava TaxID=63121 RepID=UPI003969EEA1
MSASLVRRGLELFKDDIKSESVADSLKKKRQRIAKGEDKMALIGTNKKGVKKKLRRLQNFERFKKGATVKDKKIKSAIDSYWKTVPKDNTRTNLEYMLRRSSNTQQSFHKIISHHEGKNLLDIAEKEEDTTIFDESDFEKFEKEYHGNTTR